MDDKFPPEAMLRRLSMSGAYKDLPPETLLRRSELATALTEAGFPIVTTTLATKAVRGGGPPFRYFGRIPLYPWGEALNWARGRLTGLISNTSGGPRGHLTASREVETA